jgi:23S rRNA pseudouridine1911/1915/1917 synthase
MNVEVLYEDNHLIAVLKPAGVLTQGDASGEKCLMDCVKEYLKVTYGKPGNVFLGLLHRLDRNVSGIVLFAKTSKGASRVSEQFRDHSVSKIYEAWICGIPKEPKGTLINHLVKNERTNKTAVFETEVPGSLFAELSYETLREERGFTLVRIALKTGRSHQIRAQFARMGNPIAGDTKYGAPKALENQEILLRAVELSFETATGGERKTVTVGPPELKV